MSTRQAFIVDAIRTPSGTVLAVNTSYGMNIGYTVMW